MLVCQEDFHISSAGASQGAGPGLKEYDLSVGMLQALLQPRIDIASRISSGQLWLSMRDFRRDGWMWEPRGGGACATRTFPGPIKL